MPAAVRRNRPAARTAAAVLAALLVAGGTGTAQETGDKASAGEARGAAQTRDAGAAPLTHLAQVGAAFQSCWRAPPGSAGSRITLRFGLSASGRLKGPPLATFSELAGSAGAQRAFVAAALTAIARCTPLVMRADLARVVASRVLTVTFVAPVRGLDI